MDRKNSFAALLIVVGVSVVFGMILGGRLNAPDVMLAAQDTSWLRAPQEAAAAPPGPVSFADIAEDALPAVVAVQNMTVQTTTENPHRDDPMFRWFFGPSPERRTTNFGSGFVISQEGYILTNNHVVEESTRLTVELQTGDEFEATVVGTDPSIDLALLKIDAEDRELPTLPLGDSSRLRVGEWVLAIGNPLGLEYTVTVGVVSAKARNFPIGETLPGVASFIQTDAAINKGNSGGPLLDAQGRVVGINTAIFRGDMANQMVEGVGFALPINAARDAVEQILKTGSVQRGYLGITMNRLPLDDEAREYYGLKDTDGVLISEVQAGMPAERAGLRAGDIIRKVDGVGVKDNNDLLSKIATRRPGETVDLEVFRKGKTVDIQVRLASRAEGVQALADSGRGRLPRPEQEARPAAGLGIEVENLNERVREQLGYDDDVRGVVITQVDAASEAADKGIIPRMVITSINDDRTRDVGEWNRVIGNLVVGDLVKVELRLPNGQTSLVFLRVKED